MSFTARYHGRCACCEERIEPGDTVAYEDESLVCESCSASDDKPAARPAPSVCKRCWLVQPCDCEPAA